MLSKCVNPGCTASFRYLHSGRLFQFETRSRPQSQAEGERMPVQGVEFFWLCEDCAIRYWLVYDPDRGGVRVVPYSRREAGAS
jgi:hypothetical protein